jgi:DNA polymerase III subunit delta
VKVAPGQLGAQLRRALAPVYLVAGNEPLLVAEAADSIRTQARAQGYDERELHVVERGFDWNLVRASGDSPSLFAQQRLIELRLASASPGEDGSEVLVQHAQRPPPDTVLLVIAPALDRKSAGSKWVVALEAAGVLVEVRSVGLSGLGRWVGQRMRAVELEPTPAAVTLIAERVEGNLLAAAQEIEKLRLLHGAGALDEQAVRDAVADSARYDVDALSDATLAGDRARALRVLDGLHGEGVEPVLILWALMRDLRWLCALAWERATGRRSKLVYGIWQSRRRAVEAAQARGRLAQWHALLLQGAEVDGIVKGRAPGNPWQAVTGLVAAMASVGAA